MRIIIGILFLLTTIICAQLCKNIKCQNIMLYLFSLCICFRLSFSITSGSEFYFVRYAVDYLEVSLLDFFILNFGFLFIFNLRKYKRKNNKDLVIITIFTIIHIISYKFAINKAATIMATIRVIKLLFLYLYFSRTFDINTQKKYIISGLSTGVIIQSFIAILQKINNGPIGLSIIGEELGAFRIREVTGVISTGMAGTFQHSGAFAIYAVFAFCIIIFSFDCLKTSKYYMSIISCLVIMYLAESRTVLVLAVFVIIIFFIKSFNLKLNPKVSVLFFFFIFVGTIFIALFGGHLFSLFLSSDIDNMLSTRFSQWDLGLFYISQHPVSGYGANNFTDTMYTYAPAAFNEIFNYQNPIHNTYLQYWFDLGIFGFITVVILQFRNFIALAIQKKKNISINSIKSGALVFILVSILYYMTGWSLLQEPMIEMSWICYGIVYNIPWYDNDNEGSISSTKKC